MNIFSRRSIIPLSSAAILIIFCSLLASWVYPSQTGFSEQEQFDFANGLYSRKFFDMAAVEYQKFLAKFPKTTRRELALYRLGECYRLLGQIDKAIQTYQKQLSSFPDGQRVMHARYRLSELLLQKQNYEAASIHLKKIIVHPDVGKLKDISLLKLGDCYQKLNQPQKAIQTWLKIDEQSQVAVSAAFMIGNVLLKQNQKEKALPYFKKVSQKKESPLCPEATFRIGEILYSLGRYKDSRKAYLAAAQFVSSEFFIPSVLGILWVDYWEGDFERGLEVFNRYKDLIPGERRAEALFLAGNFYERKKDFKEAVRIFALARSYKSGTPYIEESFFRQLWCLLKLGKNKQVVEQGEEFLKSFPRSVHTADVLFFMGNARYNLGDYQSALCCLKQCLEKKPPSSFTAEALLRLGETQKELSDFYAASKTLETLLSTYPNTQHRERSMYLLGACYAQQERFDELKEVYEKLLLLNPKSQYSGEVHYWVGLVYMKKGNYHKAMNHLRKVVDNYRKNPFFKNALKRLGECAYFLGNKEEAAGHFLKLTRMDPSARLSVETYLWLGQYLCNAQRWTEALKIYRLLEKNCPTESKQQYETMLYGRGKAYLGLKQWAKATQDFSILMDKFPGSPRADEYRLLLGISLRNLKEYDRAQSFLLEAAKSTQPAIASHAQLELGNIHFDQNEFQEASRLYMRVFILYDHPDFSPQAQLRAGKCLELMNKPKEAANCYRELIERYPNTTYAEEAKKRLGR